MASVGTVIIGAGLCGGNAAATLREEGYRERVVLVGDEPTAPFGRPPTFEDVPPRRRGLDGMECQDPRLV